MSCLPSLGLSAPSRMVLTDSGGIQERTAVLAVPCLTMRPGAKQPLTCEIGTKVLAGGNPRRILRKAHSALDGNARSGAIPGKWDGHAAERIVDILSRQPARASRLVSAQVSPAERESKRPWKGYPGLSRRKPVVGSAPE